MTHFRPAHIGEEIALTGLARRSIQARWAYSDEFMDWEPEEISVSAHHISSGITRVIEAGGSVLGFYVLQGDELSRLMVAAEALGTGLGRLLWQDAVDQARFQGLAAIRLDADPNAVPFYERMGAVQLGPHDWEPPMMPGWRVVKMRFDLSTRQPKGP